MLFIFLSRNSYQSLYEKHVADLGGMRETRQRGYSNEAGGTAVGNTGTYIFSQNLLYKNIFKLILLILILIF